VNRAARDDARQAECAAGALRVVDLPGAKAEQLDGWPSTSAIRTSGPASGAAALSSAASRVRARASDASAGRMTMSVRVVFMGLRVPLASYQIK
jgi:hypothetical protein